MGVGPTSTCFADRPLAIRAPRQKERDTRPRSTIISSRTAQYHQSTVKSSYATDSDCGDDCLTSAMRTTMSVLQL